MNPARMLGTALLWLAVAAILVFIAAPIVVTVAVSFSTLPFLMFPPVGFTWSWFGRALVNREFLDGLRLSLEIGLIAAVASSLLGTAAALGLARANMRGAAVIQAFLLSPLVFPMLVTGIAFLQFFNVWAFRAAFWQLAIAHTVITLPYVVRTVTASLQLLDRNLEAVARTLGAGPLEVLVKVTLPLILNGIVAGAVLAFVTSFDNFPVSMWLVNAEYRTLPLTIFSLIDRFLDPTIAAISSLTVVLSLITAIVVERAVGLRRFAAA